MNQQELDIAAKHLLIAAIWADAPEGTNPRASANAKREALSIVTQFAIHMGVNTWEQVKACKGYGSHPDAGTPAAALGHDIYLTCAGHGAGFFDRNELDPQLREALTRLCGWRSPMGELNASFYRGWLQTFD